MAIEIDRNSWFTSETWWFSMLFPWFFHDFPMFSHRSWCVLPRGQNHLQASDIAGAVRNTLGVSCWEIMGKYGKTPGNFRRKTGDFAQTQSYVSKHIYIYNIMYIYIHMYIYIYIHYLYICTLGCTYIHIYTYVYIDTYVYIIVYTYIYRMG